MGGSLEAMGCPINRLVNLCIVEDDVWALSAEFKSYVLEIALGGSLHNLPPDEGRASESDFFDMHVLANRLTSGVPISDDEVEYTRGEASLVEHLSRHESGQGSELGRLHDDSVSGGESRADLPTPHQNYEDVRERVQ